ncbi:putative aquaporin-9 [Dictyocaulus viviparus]|uniref:Putative aquaporin-9 n=1 Tax=Dictyocaulus viviparus TaxID=29172 RepID=A0A0D8Y6K4_DICVI|nr:putative aquaporin-9 [Dictyocaulus viviparus]
MIDLLCYMDKIRSKVHIKNDLGRALIAEFMGTALLLLIGNCVVAQSVLPRPKLNEMIGVNVGFGLAIAFGVAISAKISGGHINPAVSLMFLSFRQLAPVRFVLYTLVQTAGAFVGSALAYALYHEAINQFDGGVRTIDGVKGTAGIFASYPAAHLGLFNGLIDQIIATAVFCFLIAHITDKKNSYPTWLQPLLIGLSFVAVGAGFGYNCGYPCNPARDFGPRLFTFIIGYGGDVFSYKSWFWVPIVGPFIGALIGAWLYQLAIGFHTPQDVEEKYVVLTGNQELKPLTGKDGEEA